MKAINEITSISTSARVYEKIKDMILHLEIRPGEKIPEEKITEIVKCSRTPVREAIRKLSEEGLVSIYPNRYSEVKQYNESDIKKIGELRLSQDILSCQLAIRNGSNSDFSQLKEIAEKCRISAEKGDIYERISLDSQFHLEIAKIGRNDLLIESQEKLYMKIHIVQISKYTNIEDSINQISKHSEIVDALFDRDDKRVKNLLCQHLEDFFNIDQEIINMYLN
ncbi:GntR family transcriptional regulator [Sedimentibacter sp.]|uniref:GntR family transcriptional regulator n=1 Tax=Sedimentibacter sp. TaxID=1960295 RepID=UPI00289A2057|nr:GntR family transcriptional regulator [Sedimentibacter sp.]